MKVAFWSCKSINELLNKFAFRARTPRTIAIMHFILYQLVHLKKKCTNKMILLRRHKELSLYDNTLSVI